MPVIDNLGPDESVTVLTQQNKKLRSVIAKMRKSIRAVLKVEAERHRIEIQFFEEPEKARASLNRLKRAEIRAWLNLGKVGMTS